MSLPISTDSFSLRVRTKAIIVLLALAYLLLILSSSHRQTSLLFNLNTVTYILNIAARQGITDKKIMLFIGLRARCSRWKLQCNFANPPVRTNPLTQTDKYKRPQWGPLYLWRCRPSSPIPARIIFPWFWEIYREFERLNPPVRPLLSENA